MNACQHHDMSIALSALPTVYWAAVLTSATATYDAKLISNRKG